MVQLKGSLKKRTLVKCVTLVQDGGGRVRFKLTRENTTVLEDSHFNNYAPERLAN